jgi:circadian clock protein KaiC
MTPRMANKKPTSVSRTFNLPKAATGIQGLDAVTGGGLPKGRPTLICGGTGTGKTLMAMEFLVRGATEYGEPGVFVSFEERPIDLVANVASLGFHLSELQRQKKLAVDYVHLERTEIEETGEYNLEGLFIRLGSAIDSVKAKRIAFDSLENLYAGLQNHAVVRAELRRLFGWLKDRDISAIITAERGEGALTRYALEEYVADCVILLDHRVSDEVSTRYLRVIKYRGTSHGTNEFPFLIGENGLSVLPITSVSLDFAASHQRISSGIPRLDEMLGGKGYYRGSSVLIAGNPGTGKTSFAASFADSICRNGQRCLYVAFEESPAQMMRNMGSIGIDLKHWTEKGLLKFYAVRPTARGLEEHLLTIWDLIVRWRPEAVVLDPITNLISIGALQSVTRMLMRLIVYIKSRGLTGVCTALLHDAADPQLSFTGIASAMDTRLMLMNQQANGEHNRLFYIMKSRGAAHSNQIREFKLTDRGVQILDVYTSPGQVLTGSARVAQEAIESDEKAIRNQVLENRRRDLVQRETVIKERIRILEKLIETGGEVFEGFIPEDKSHVASPKRRKKTPMKPRIVAAHVNGAIAPSTEEP